ncbi:MAG: DUF5071 domain-containing protein [Vannielia sp.]|uniref:DUF5071 domain-containing protein n=1 Tax=Vannielia sp. TaxID=2813045 RepID=UPI003B8AF309
MAPHPCIPADKHDLPAVRRAAALPAQELVPLLPALLEWVQDANWPVARPVAALLASTGEALLPHLETVFAGEDSVWKYWIIDLVVPALSPEVRARLHSRLTQLADSPAPGDRAEEVHLVARQALDTAARP